MDDFFPRRNSAKPVTLKRPPELPASYEYLASGAYGNVYSSGGGTTVQKLFENKNLQYACDEYAKLNALSKLATEYLPVPCMLTKVGDIPTLRMTNAGNALRDLSRSNPLTCMEYALCILQSIHFVLLINDEFTIFDMHSGNICLRWRGANISLRFIDVGLWEDNRLKHDHLKIQGNEGILHNANILFWDERDSIYQVMLKQFITKEIMRNELFCRLARPLFSILQKSGRETHSRNHKNVYGMLMSLATAVQNCMYAHGDMTEAYQRRVEDLMDKILHAYHVSLLGLRPQAPLS